MGVSDGLDLSRVICIVKDFGSGLEVFGRVRNYFGMFKVLWSIDNVVWMVWV